jgi:hypothetical protein
MQLKWEVQRLIATGSHLLSGGNGYENVLNTVVAQ